MSKGLLRSLKRGPALDQHVIKEKLSVNLAVTVTSVGAAIGFGSGVLAGLPEGNIRILGLVANLAFAGSGSDANLGDTWSGDFALGTTPADDATISVADEDILVETAIGPATAEAIAAAQFTEITQPILDNTPGDGELNLSILIDAADIVDDQSVVITVTGDLHLAYLMLGDD